MREFFRFTFQLTHRAESAPYGARRAWPRVSSRHTPGGPRLGALPIAELTAIRRAYDPTYLRQQDLFILSFPGASLVTPVPVGVR